MRAAASGTTSACAENTGIIRVAVSPRRNYLRVRGEYSTGITGVRWVPELPPRARRILAEYAESLSITGTTSACAENTPYGCMPTRKPGNYLRVRGEYTRGGLPTGRTRELPPRARRIPPFFLRAKSQKGTTSACAENTHPPTGHLEQTWNYLRVRGEYETQIMWQMLHMELPPRARRIPEFEEIPTADIRNYLRVRGEY